jgi:hypothetical protein
MKNTKTPEPGWAAVFCTAFVESDPRRYQAWIDYYTDFFAGENVDLYLYNDGPVAAALDLKGAQLVTFPETLGRQGLWRFPGWKRSFSTAVRELGARYRFLSHIESDTILLKQGRAEFLQALRQRGYRTGYTRLHDFIETAIQVLNTRRSREFFCRRYAEPCTWAREEDFEKTVQYALQPSLFLHGERMEGQELNLEAHYSYLSQMPIYLFLEQYPDGEVPWKSPANTSLPISACARRMRLRWAIKYLGKRLRGRI